MMRDDDLVPIFLSVGKIFREDQGIFLKNLRCALQPVNFELRALKRNDSSSEVPLAQIQASMNTCQGIIIVAFPRFSYEKGYEWPDSPQQISLEKRFLPTVWLQIEATLAFQLELPKLVLVDDRLHQEGLLNPKHKEYHAIPFHLEACQTALPEKISIAINEFVERVWQHKCSSK